MDEYKIERYLNKTQQMPTWYIFLWYTIILPKSDSVANISDLK